MKLNLGCGEKKLLGYVNVDLCGTPDVICDLSLFPWLWENNSVDEVYAAHFLEHVQNFEQTILEIYRILKPGGVLHFKVPHFRSPMAQWFLHKNCFSVYTCHLLCQSIPYQWSGKKLFEFQNVRLNYSFVRRSVGSLFGPVANIHPLLWDWLGLPIDEVEFTATKVSD